MQTETFSDAASRFVTAPVRARTYKRLAYLLLAFPLGMAYFVGFTIGASTGASLLITVVGVPVLLATLAGATTASGLEAYLTRTLLDRDVPVPAMLEGTSGSSFTDPEGGYLAAVKQFLVEPTTWTSVAVVLVKFVYGTIAFVATVSAGSVVLALLSTPFVYDSSTITYRIGQYVIDTFPEAIAAFGFGLISLFVAVNALNVLADFGGFVTERLLVAGRENVDA